MAYLDQDRAADLTAIQDQVQGDAGITTWPAAAAPANAVSLAEAIRYIVETQIGAPANTGGVATLAAILGDPANSSLAARLVTLAAEISGAAGIASYPAAAAPGNAVSIAEVLRDLWDVVRNGTGGAEPATNKSIMDYLGVSPAFFVPGLGYKVSKTEDVNTATGDDLFDVTGKVLITCLTGEVTNAIGAAVNDYKLRIKTDNIDLCAAGDINSDAIGTMYSLTGDASDSLVTAAEGIKAVDHSDSGMANRVVGLAGGTCTIQSLRTAGDASDAIIWTMFYLPLEAAAAVAAAA